MANGHHRGKGAFSGHQNRAVNPTRHLGTMTSQLFEQHTDDINGILHERVFSLTCIHLAFRHVSAFKNINSADSDIKVRCGLGS